MKKTTPIIFIFVLLILSVSFVFAIPSIPNVFSGTVEYSDNPGMLLTDYDISASVGGYPLGIIGEIQSSNIYEVMVDPQGHGGEIIFYIGGVEASPTATYEMGELTELDLTINELPTNALCGNGMQEPGEQCDGSDLGTGTCENILGLPGATGTLSCTDICTFDYSNCAAPYCGDGTCNNDETCSSCPQDCGDCPSNDNGGDDSSNNGGSPIQQDSITNDSDNQNDILSIESLNEADKERETGAGITGAIIGFAGSGTGTVLIFVLLVILLGIGVVLLKKKSPKNE